MTSHPYGQMPSSERLPDAVYGLQLHFQQGYQARQLDTPHNNPLYQLLGILPSPDMKGTHRLLPTERKTVEYDAKSDRQGLPTPGADLGKLLVRLQAGEMYLH